MAESIDRTQLAAAANTVEVGTVLVVPGNRTFPTIAAALASINDASLEKQYQVLIGPGTYNEQVVCKPWVFISGPYPTKNGTYPATISMNVPNDNPVLITGASNASITNVALSAEPSRASNSPASLCTIAVDSATKFSIENVSLSVYDRDVSFGPVIGLRIDANGSGSRVYFADGSINATADATNPLYGFMVQNGGYLEVTNSTITAVSSGNGIGGAAASKATASIYGTNVSAQQYSLVGDPNTNAIITAQSCTLNPAPGPGVVTKP